LKLWSGSDLPLAEPLKKELLSGHSGQAQLQPVNTFGQAGDVGRGMGLQRIDAFAARAAIGVELDQADGQQLHHLARIVLVWHAARPRVGLLVAHVR